MHGTAANQGGITMHHYALHQLLARQTYTYVVLQACFFAYHVHACTQCQILLSHAMQYCFCSTAFSPMKIVFRGIVANLQHEMSSVCLVLWPICRLTRKLHFNRLMNTPQISGRI